MELLNYDYYYFFNIFFELPNLSKIKDLRPAKDQLVLKFAKDAEIFNVVLIKPY